MSTSPDVAHLPSFQFGGGGELADELAALVLQGRKTATCTTVDEYREKGWPIPQPGELWVMTDSQGAALAVLETISAIITSAGSVDARFAFDEGEGDRTLASWRAAHERYFSSQGRCLTDDTLLVCERFKIVQRLPLTPAPAHPSPAAPRP